MMEQVEQKRSPSEESFLYDVFVRRTRDWRFSRVEQISITKMVSALDAGVTGRVLATLSEVIPKQVIISTVRTDPTNYSKLIRKKHLSASQTEELNDLTMLWSEMLEFFDGDREMVEEWIESPIYALDGAIPSNLLKSQFGREAIRKTLDEMRYGDFG